MNGVHDMGGMPGMGPIRPQADEPVFHALWEGRAYALNRAAGAFLGNAHARRFAIEILPPEDYFRMSYYEKWFVRMENMLVNMGHITREEASSGKAASGTARQTPRLTAAAVPAAVFPSIRRVLTGPAPRFRPGQQVRTRKMNPEGHTRLPRYARDRFGTIAGDNGVFPFPDTLAHLQADKPQHCYSVRFAAQELWGEQAKPRDSVYIDLWEDYLEPA